MPGKPLPAEDVDLDELAPRRRMLYEIEKLLDVDEKRLRVEAVRKSKHEGAGRARIPNRDFYRIYKAMCRRLNTEPRFVYTGNDVLEADKVEQDLRELEPSL